MKCIVRLASFLVITSMSAGAAAQSDVRIDSPPATDVDPIVVDVPVDYEVVVSNRGDQATGAFDIVVETRHPRLFVWLEIARIPVPRGIVAGGRGVRLAYQVSYPNASAFPLSVRTTLAVDGDADPADNVHVETGVLVVAATIDFEVTKAPAASPLDLCQGGQTTVRFEVTNHGTIAAGAFEIAILDFVVVRPTLLKTQLVREGLGPGETRAVAVPVELATAKRYRLSVQLDHGNAFDESDEQNNLTGLEKNPTAWSGSNLTMATTPAVSRRAPSMEPYPIEVGAWTLANACVGDARTFNVSYYVSKDTRITTDDRLVWTSDPLRMEGGARVILSSVDVKFPSLADTTNYWFGILIDPLEQTDDFDRSDNVWVHETRTGDGIVPSVTSTWGALKTRF